MADFGDYAGQYLTMARDAPRVAADLVQTMQQQQTAQAQLPGIRAQSQIAQAQVPIAQAQIPYAGQEAQAKLYGTPFEQQKVAVEQQLARAAMERQAQLAQSLVQRRNDETQQGQQRLGQSSNRGKWAWGPNGYEWFPNQGQAHLPPDIPMPTDSGQSGGGSPWAGGATQNAQGQRVPVAPQAGFGIGRPLTPEQVLDQAHKLRTSQEKALEPIDAVQQDLTQAKQLLATSSPASDIQLQKVLAGILDPRHTASAVLKMDKNFGTLSERMQGFVSRVFTGQYTDSQREQIRGMISDLENNVVSPQRNRIGQYHKDIAKQSGIPDSLIPTPNFYQDQGWKIERQ